MNILRFITFNCLLIGSFGIPEERCRIHQTPDGYCYHSREKFPRCIRRKTFYMRNGRSIYLQCKAKYVLEQIHTKGNEPTGTSAKITCTKGKLAMKYRCNRECTISDSFGSSKYRYTDDTGNEIILPHTVLDGTQIYVECKDNSYLDGFYGEVETEKITCVNGIFSAVSMDCQYSPNQAEHSDSCENFKVMNGVVSHNAMGQYFVTCHPGYTLNSPSDVNGHPCECSNGHIVCFAGKKPVCKPDNCPIPLDTDKRLSVYKWRPSSRVDLSEGDTIRNQAYVYFNCSNVIEQKYEPANRRFQCVRGQWMEADRNPNWKLGNNGAFPECREAICDPPCENGGVCFRDGLCRCEHMTTGERCQTFVTIGGASFARDFERQNKRRSHSALGTTRV